MKSVRTHYNNAMAILVTMKGLAARCAEMETATERISWDPQSNFNTLTISGQIIHLSDLCKLVHDLQDSCQKQLKKILLGIAIPKELQKLADDKDKLKDDVKSISAGYSFLVEGSNGLHKFSDLLLKKITNEHACLQPDGTVTLKKEALEKWFKLAQKFLSTLMTLIHISSGQPSRGEEMASYLVGNLGGIRARSFYWKNGTFMLVQHYAKTRSMANKDVAVARFLDKVTRNLLLAYLVMVRPVEATLLHQLDNTKNPSIYKLYFLVGHGEQFSGGDVCNYFRKVLQEHGMLGIGIREWRHVATAFMRHHCKLQVLAGDLIGFDEQAAHGVDTAELHYARTATPDKALTAEKELRDYMATESWWELLGLKAGRSHTKWMIGN